MRGRRGRRGRESIEKSESGNKKYSGIERKKNSNVI